VYRLTTDSSENRNLPEYDTPAFAKASAGTPSLNGYTRTLNACLHAEALAKACGSISEFSRVLPFVIRHNNA